MLYQLSYALGVFHGLDLHKQKWHRLNTYGPDRNRLKRFEKQSRFEEGQNSFKSTQRIENSCPTSKLEPNFDLLGTTSLTFTFDAQILHGQTSSRWSPVPENRRKTRFGSFPHFHSLPKQHGDSQHRQVMELKILRNHRKFECSRMLVAQKRYLPNTGDRERLRSATIGAGARNLLAALEL
ncbi:MAG: hypothetical protein WCK86_05570 [Planctomycetia bacterium]